MTVRTLLIKGDGVEHTGFNALHFAASELTLRSACNLEPAKLLETEIIECVSFFSPLSAKVGVRNSCPIVSTYFKTSLLPMISSKSLTSEISSLR